MKTLPVLAGLLIIIGGVAVGVGAVRYQTNQTVKAAENYRPNQVKVTNVSDTGFTVSWITNQATTGYVVYGENEDSLQMKSVDDRDKDQGNLQSYFVHYVNVQGLRPATTYFYKIGSNNQIFDLSGFAYKLTTGKILNDQPMADAAYGQVVTESNEPAGGTIVYLQISGGGLASALTKPTGAWAIPLSMIRTDDLNSYLNFDKTKQAISIWIESGNLGNSSVSTKADLISPVPNVVLGKIYDFTQFKAQQAASTSKFVKSAGLTPKDVELISPTSEESLGTSRPIILGKAPPGTKISIEVNSETKISSEVLADDLGNFSFQVPQNLTPGEHTVTITAVVNGVLKTIRKSFVVEAAEIAGSPYYSATPSSTLKPTVVATITVKPTTTPKPTLTPKPTQVVPTTTNTPTTKPSVTPKPSATAKPTPSLVPTATLKPVLIEPTQTPEIPKSGTTGMTMWSLVLGASLMLLGYTMGNEKKRIKVRL